MDRLSVIDQLRYLSQGINPLTSECFDLKCLSESQKAKNSIVALSYFAGLSKQKPESINQLNRPTEKIFQLLREWRNEKAHTLGFPAYYIFTDQDLENIANGDVVNIEDLLNVKGIGPKKYELYSKEIFDILKDFI